MKNSARKHIAIIGSGPAALMAASVLCKNKHVDVSVFERRKGPGRKLLIAGSSGLNVTNELAPEEFCLKFSPPLKIWKELLTDFSPKDWLKFIESLGLKTFLGTSNRYFVTSMKASKLVRVWTSYLNTNGVRFVFSHTFKDFSLKENKVLIDFEDGLSLGFDAACFALGGASYDREKSYKDWFLNFESKGLVLEPFLASNVGFEVNWNSKFLEESEGRPLKNIRLTTSKGSMLGDLMITSYGVEGTPVYTLGEVGSAFLDLKPDLSKEALMSKLQGSKENIKPIRRLKKFINLTSHSLIFHHTPKEIHDNADQLANTVKQFQIKLLKPRPIFEAISTKGGLSISELDSSLMLQKFSGVFAAGEMLAWDAPTGGFLIQGCVSQGYRVGKGILKYLRVE